MAKMKDHTNDVLKEVDRLIGNRLVIAALMVERSAKQMVPVDTGTLRRSITHEPQKPRRKIVVGSNVEYAPFVEMGTSKMSSRPYLRPALHANMEKIRKLFGGK